MGNLCTCQWADNETVTQSAPVQPQAASVSAAPTPAPPIPAPVRVGGRTCSRTEQA